MRKLGKLDKRCLDPSLSEEIREDLLVLILMIMFYIVLNVHIQMIFERFVDLEKGIVILEDNVE